MLTPSWQFPGRLYATQDQASRTICLPHLSPHPPVSSVPLPALSRLFGRPSPKGRVPDAHELGTPPNRSVEFDILVPVVVPRPLPALSAADNHGRIVDTERNWPRRHVLTADIRENCSNFLINFQTYSFLRKSAKKR